MFHAFDQIVAMVFVKINNQFCYTSIQQFYAAEFSDICCYHHRIHSFDSWIDIHEFGDICSEACHTAMKQVYTIN